MAVRVVRVEAGHEVRARGTTASSTNSTHGRRCLGGSRWGGRGRNAQLGEDRLIVMQFRDGEQSVRPWGL